MLRAMLVAATPLCFLPSFPLAYVYERVVIAYRCVSCRLSPHIRWEEHESICFAVQKTPSPSTWMKSDLENPESSVFIVFISNVRTTCRKGESKTAMLTSAFSSLYLSQFYTRSSLCTLFWGKPDFRVELLGVFTGPPSWLDWWLPLGSQGSTCGRCMH